MIIKSLHLKDSFEAHLSLVWQSLQLLAVTLQCIGLNHRCLVDSVCSLSCISLFQGGPSNQYYYYNGYFFIFEKYIFAFEIFVFIEVPGSKVRSSWGILNQEKVPLVHSKLLPFRCGITSRPSEILKEAPRNQNGFNSGHLL